MQVHRSIENLPFFRKAVVTIGTFDGVHAGHRTIVAALTERAKEVGGESVIITFDPHPRKVVRPQEPMQLINTLEEKIELLSKTGIDHLVIVPFTPGFSALSADDYISEFLVRQFYPHTIIIGYDHHFGKERKGNFAMLQARSEQFGYVLQEIPKHVLDEIDVSSTKIRNAILQSDIQTANMLLGYPFFFEGVVIKGDQLGRKLGFPTANLEYTDAEKIHLGHGVYAVYATVGGKRKKGMMSIGVRPTLTHSDERVEVNIFDWNEEIYGTVLKVEVIAFLRGQEKYDSLDQLVAQLHLDKETSLSML